MSAEGNKALIRRYVEEVWNKGNLSVIGEILATKFIRHDPADPEPVSSSEGLKQVVTMYRTAFPDVHFTIDDQIAEGDKVATRWRGSGTHKGSLRGIAPTGKESTVTGIVISRIVGGKIVEEWGNWDTLGMLQQLGVVPKMG
jgi:steroid delta-isomerase-like uncharacterized protein